MKSALHWQTTAVQQARRTERRRDPKATPLAVSLATAAILGLLSGAACALLEHFIRHVL